MVAGGLDKFGGYLAISYSALEDRVNGTKNIEFPWI
jgi:hypothetical protein